MGFILNLISFRVPVGFPNIVVAIFQTTLNNERKYDIKISYQNSFRICKIILMSRHVGHVGYDVCVDLDPIKEDPLVQELIMIV